MEIKKTPEVTDLFLEPNQTKYIEKRIGAMNYVGFVRRRLRKYPKLRQRIQFWQKRKIPTVTTRYAHIHISKSVGIMDALHYQKNGINTSR